MGVFNPTSIAVIQSYMECTCVTVIRFTLFTAPYCSVRETDLSDSVLVYNLFVTFQL